MSFLGAVLFPGPLPGPAAALCPVALCHLAFPVLTAPQLVRPGGDHLGLPYTGTLGG